MNKFAVVIPILNQHEFFMQCFESFQSLSKDKVNYLLIDNGSDDSLLDKIGKSDNIQIHRNESNIGVYPTFKQAYDILNKDKDFEWLFFSHSDVEILEPGWDVRLSRILDSLGDNAGVCGMYGAKGIGTPDIYKAPYRKQQMIRVDCYTVYGMLHDRLGKPIQADYEEIMVLDGFSLICNTKMIAKADPFNMGNFGAIHHMYDNRICLKSSLAGYKNYVIDIDCVHHGGRTSTHEKWAHKFNTTDERIHDEAHKLFYEEFRGILPRFVDNGK